MDGKKLRKKWREDEKLSCPILGLTAAYVTAYE